MTHLVIGSKGQVGLALVEVLSEKYEVFGIDMNDFLPQQFDVIHICLPYTDQFEDVASAYITQYLAPNGLVVIHSTVAVGTSKKLNAVHSPIRGVHPKLADGIRKFEKYFGGDRAEEAAQLFEGLCPKVTTTSYSDTTEALKLWDTTYYGWNIIFEKAVKAYCEEHNLDFNIIYTAANQSYNEGYTALGRSDVCRPVLLHCSGKIGGHCVVPNATLLGGDIAGFIMSKNEEY